MRETNTCERPGAHDGQADRGCPVRHGGRRLLLAEAPGEVRRFVTGGVSLAEGRESSWVTVTRTGRFSDPRYGKFEISRPMLEEMVRNFDEGAYGQKVFVDVAHKPDDGAAGEITRLAVEGDRLRALVAWTDYGRDAVQKRGFTYLSAEFHENWKDNERGDPHGCVLLGAGLVTRPCIKRLDPVQLSEHDAEVPLAVHPRLLTELIEEIRSMKEKLLKQLRERLQALKLGETVIENLVKQLAAQLEAVTEEPVAQALAEAFEGVAKQLSEAGASIPESIQVKVNVPAAAGITLDDVKKFLSEQEGAAKTLAENLAGKRKLFDDTLAEVGKALAEDTRAEIAAIAAALITAETPDATIKALAEKNAKLAEKFEASRQLSAMGFTPQGRPYISVDSSNNVKALQEAADQRLGIAAQPEAQRFKATGGQLQEANKAIAERVLAEFDAARAPELVREHKLLAGGDGVVSDVAVPTIFERTVIREALYRMVGLSFVNTGTLPFSTSAFVPYSYRDTTAAGKGDTRTYEGQGIKRAGVIQTGDNCYPIPQKLAFEVSDELRYLTGNGQLNWDVLAENARNAVRIIGEDSEQLIFDEVLNASDEYSTVAVAGEAVASGDGTKTTFVLNNFPVVRPRKIFDLQGNQVGNTVNPVEVRLNNVVIAEWAAGVGAGTYYVMDYNLGEVSFVDENGDAVAAPNTQPVAASYSYTTNVFAFDTDLGGSTVKDKWDDFLYRYGLRKSLIEDQRSHMCDFGLMSGTVMNSVERAGSFVANFKRNGTDLTGEGNLGQVKGVANFKSYAPGLAMGDQRILLGERGVTRWRMMKPWRFGQLENQRDVNGRFTGKKEAYGDQFIVLHTPTPLKRAMTSVVLYSATARVDR